MPYNEYLADRIRQELHQKNTPYIEKKMMGGLCFMVDDKMCAGVVKDNLMVRINPDSEQELLAQPGARAMDFTGRPMKGFLFVEGLGWETDLPAWIDRALAYNPLARSSKKKK